MKSKKVIVQTVVALCAAALIIAGIFNGGPESVFYKAVYICLECIGIG